MDFPFWETACNLPAISRKKSNVATAAFSKAASPSSSFSLFCTNVRSRERACVRSCVSACEHGLRFLQTPANEGKNGIRASKGDKSKKATFLLLHAVSQK